MSYFTNKFDGKVTRLLQAGGVGLLPTDTIYGLSAVALNEEAVEKVHILKGRDSHKPLVVLISDFRQLESLGLSIDHADLIKKYWPGPLSVIFESPGILGWLERGTKSLAVRVPDHQDLLTLIQKVGPIVSTSANLQAHVPAKSVSDAQKYFGDHLDFYVDAGEMNGQSSTLVKIENGRIRILRPGALRLEV